MSTEKEWRERAYRHRGEVVPGSGVPVTPRQLATIVSVRLPAEMAVALRTAAENSGETLSDLLRRAAMALVSKPIGYQCEHLNVTSNPGVLGPVSAACGCELRPVYHVSELADPDYRRRCNE